MHSKLSEPVSVVLGYDSRTRTTRPLSLTWAGTNYPVLKIGLHHTYHHGDILYHIFSIASRELFFRLKLDTTTLHWVLEEVSDGLPD